MAYFFDQDVYLRYIYRYNAVAKTYSGNLATAVTVGYFDDTAQVGDCLYLGLVSSINGAAPFHDLTFNVGTPLVADSIDLVWEYYTQSGWTAIPNLTDNTNNFTTSGINTVSFPIPPNWHYRDRFFLSRYTNDAISNVAYANTASAIYVRCRINSVTNLSEGGHQTSQRVTAKDYTIVVDDEPSASLTSLYNADVANGWGVVSRDDTDTVVMANLRLTGTTVLTAKEESFRLGSSTYPYIIAVPDETASLVFGQKDSAGFGVSGVNFTNHTKGMLEGSSVLICNWKVYGSRIWRTPTQFMGLAPRKNVEILDSIFSTDYLSFQDINPDSAIRRTFLDFTHYWYVYTPNIAVDGVVLSGLCKGVLCGKDALVQNMTFTGSQTVLRYYGATVTLVNCVIDNANLKPSNSNNGTSDHYIYKKFTFDLKIKDKQGNYLSGASVTIKDADGTQVASLTTDDNGAVVQQTLDVYWTWVAYAEAWKVYTRDFNPFSVTISKPGYQTKTVKYTVDRKIAEVETLEPIVPLIHTADTNRLIVNAHPSRADNADEWIEVE